MGKTPTLENVRSGEKKREERRSAGVGISGLEKVKKR
jgi:hypothetical protein